MAQRLRVVDTTLSVRKRHTRREINRADTIGTPDARSVDIPNAGALAPMTDRGPGGGGILFIASRVTSLIGANNLNSISTTLPHTVTRLRSIQILVPNCPRMLRDRGPVRVVNRLNNRTTLPPYGVKHVSVPSNLIVCILVYPRLCRHRNSPCNTGGNHS